jgi:uncharacterized protein YbaR (Trm112 family)
MNLSELLACPRCDKPLDATANGFQCAGCRVDFPIVDSLPWLFAEPNSALGEWQGRLHFSLQRLDRDRRHLAAALADSALRAATRARLEALATATDDHARRLQALLAPFELDRNTAPYETYLALRTKLPADQGLTTYYANVHRDWAWGDAENAAAAEFVASLAGDCKPRTVLVLGAGAGRLSYDLHARFAPALSVAFDFNPLLAAVARRVMAGETVELYEFPLAPRMPADHAVLRSLRAPAPAAPGIEVVLGDAQRPPFRAGAFDIVVTPWLIDILPEHFEVFATRVNALLAGGGRWLNFGSLSFHTPELAARYDSDECSAVLEENGFTPVVLDEREIPYLCSPASRHGRRELVLGWSATKAREAQRPPRYEALPDWLVRGVDPVPLSESFRSQIMSTRIHAFIMALIDGRRSLKDIAKVLVEQRMLSEAESEPAIRSFLAKMYDDSRRGRIY